jgi:hypothetical protein
VGNPQIPTSNIQKIIKLPNTENCPGAGAEKLDTLNLEFGICLEFGCWNLELQIYT